MSSSPLATCNGDTTITLINDLKEIVFCSIIDKDSPKAYSQAVAAAGLFLSILGIASGAATPTPGLLVGLGGMHLSGHSSLHNFYAARSSEVVSRVLFFNDALKSTLKGGKTGVILLVHLSIDGTQVKVTEYKKESLSDVNHVGKIIGGDFTEKKDFFTFSVVGSHKLVHRRYLTIRGLSPHGIISSSTDWKDIPEPGSAIQFDTSGKLVLYYPQKKGNEDKDLFAKCNLSHKEGAVIQFVQGESSQISPSQSVLNLADGKHTAVLRMHGWGCIPLGTKIGNALDSELQKVLDMIRDTRDQSFWGYQWVRDTKRNGAVYGDLYGLAWPKGGDGLTRSAVSEVFFVVDDEDWTYTATISKVE
ncbi:hypothetical protein Trihar35433_9220 [Trichoderma harzianum]|nr:hypothetical protein Trihar35433_9220 [Trichoderma harzianum]